jgi:UDP-N-acetylmuramoylalanine-D-glutamate ligase
MSPARVERIHFVGIGGTGMSGLAEVVLTMGYGVSGSDLSQSEVTDRLGSLGATIFVGHSAAHVVGAQLVVVSSAVRPSNPEVRKARALGIATLFCLSTQAFNYFQQKGGYTQGRPDDLPPARREKYDRSGRNSLVLLKRLQ